MHTIRIVRHIQFFVLECDFFNIENGDSTIADDRTIRVVQTVCENFVFPWGCIRAMTFLYYSPGVGGVRGVDTPFGTPPLLKPARHPTLDT